MVAAAAVLLLPASVPTTAWADIETVSATQATQMARTLPKQEVDKGGVWKVFIGGAVTLFLTTLALENNSSLFPAIARANQAAKDAKKASEDEEKRAKEEAVNFREVERQSAIVEQGLREARQKVLSTPGPSPQASAGQAAAAPVAAARAAEIHAAWQEGAAVDAEEAAKRQRLATFAESVAGSRQQ